MAAGNGNLIMPAGGVGGVMLSKRRQHMRSGNSLMLPPTAPSDGRLGLPPKSPNRLKNSTGTIQRLGSSSVNAGNLVMGKSVSVPNMDFINRVSNRSPMRQS